MSDPSEPSSRAESLLAEWLTRRESGSIDSIETVAQANPEFAAKLLQLHAEWKRMDAQEDGPGRLVKSLADRLRERFGADLDPEVSLDGDATRATSKPNSSSSSSKLYGDLLERGPSSDRYRLDGEIAHGGMGAILRVYDKDLRRNLAMKVMLEERPSLLTRFLEEAQVTGQLDHPGIVPVHELGIDERGKVFFTMKLVKGRDLRDVFDRARAEVDGWNLVRAVDVLKRVCEAMAFAHEKNVIHRDLKPGNVMVGRHGEVYVMDWGLAKVVGMKDTKDIRPVPDSHTVVDTERRDVVAETPDSSLLTMDGDAIGTPSYMPLEQAEGNLESIGPRSDIYAVGAMLYHLLSGRPPYVSEQENPTGRVILRRVLLGPPPPIRELAKDAPVELLAICEKAMARSSGARYESMSALGDDLRAYLERRVVKAHRTGPIAETRAWIARNPMLAVGLLVALVCAETFVAWQRHQSATMANAFERVLRLSDVKDVRDLTARGQLLLDDRTAVFRGLDAIDGLIEDRERWIDDARALLAKLPDHERSLAAIEARGRLDEETGALEFESKKESWWYSAVSDLVTGLRSLAGEIPDGVSIFAMREFIERDRSIVENSIGAHREEWDDCIASIANPEECPAYGGLKIVPQVGLLPIGRDPRSGLWEFWFVDGTGSRPARNDSGQLVLTDEFGIVFVLLPGGTFWMGAQWVDPSGQNYDPAAEERESPVHSVTLGPFFLSKYELTAHQWKVGLRDIPWIYHDPTPRRPAYYLSWDDAVSMLSQHRLELPTEEQWEYACRAGTSTPWSTGTTPASLAGYANLHGSSLTDLFEGFAPVGKYRPNEFGLHDMHGNIAEWCQDTLRDYAKGSTPSPPGAPVAPEERFRVIRGGSHYGEINETRSSRRLGEDPRGRRLEIGLRPARLLVD